MTALYEPLARLLLKLIEPIALVWLGLALLSVILWWKRQRALALLAAALWALVQLIGGSDFPNALLRTLERPYIGVRPEDQPIVDGIVLLGGGAEPSRYEAGGLHLTFAGDRLLMALELLRLGKARTLYLGGGSADFGHETLSEADVLKRALDARGLTSAEVVSFGHCNDTRDEALHLQEQIRQRGGQKFLLVTSAVHQRRALATFRQLGLDVTPAPCNFLTNVSTSAPSGWPGIPGHTGFARTSIWLHEQIGWQEYRRRGWL